MNWINVSSSWVDAYFYDSGDLYIRYKDKNGNITVTCHYPNVDINTWTGLLTASSKGTYIHTSGIINMPYTIL